MRRSRGFTLVEMTLVLVTISVMCAVAMPRYAASVTRYRLDCAARRVAADLALAQSQAKASSQSQTIVFTPANGTYQITGLTDVDTRAANYVVAVASEYSTTLTSANFNSSTQLTYDGFGAPSSGGSVVLSAGGAQRTISVDATSGAVTIQ